MNNLVRPARLSDSQAMYTIKIVAHAGGKYLSLVPKSHHARFLAHYKQSNDGAARFNDKLQKMLTDKSTHVYVIEHAGNIRGYIMGHYDALKNVWSLDGLFIDPAVQGTGLGSQLLEHFLVHIKSSCELLVISSNKAAIKLYEKYGFKIVVSEAGFYYGAPLAKMERLLT